MEEDLWDAIARHLRCSDTTRRSAAFTSLRDEFSRDVRTLEDWRRLARDILTSGEGDEERGPTTG